MLVVVMGLLNTIPGLPGIDDAVRAMADDPGFRIRKFSTEISFPSSLP
ncbi:MAG: hypothetical protein AAFY52_01340 [Pseudomonadota bacterium]